MDKNWKVYSKLLHNHQCEIFEEAFLDVISGKEEKINLNCMPWFIVECFLNKENFSYDSDKVYHPEDNDYFNYCIPVYCKDTEELLCYIDGNYLLGSVLIYKKIINE